MTTLPKTPEREEYERAVANVNERTHSFAELAHRLTEKAADFGVVVTIKEAPLMPPAMGRYDLITEVRPHRNLQQQVAALEAAAKASEQAREQAVDAAVVAADEVCDACNGKGQTRIGGNPAAWRTCGDCGGLGHK